MENYHEPWTNENGKILTSSGETVADSQLRYEHYFDDDYARRIVACVNACAGLDIELLEQLGVLVETFLNVANDPRT